MNRFPFLLAFGFALSLAGQAWGQEYVPGEVLVRFRPESRLAETVLPIAFQAQVQQRLEGIDVFRLKLRPGKSVNSAVNEIRRHPMVEFVEPNYRVQAFQAPNDPNFPSQWNLARINAVPGWSLSMGSAEVIIAVLDTGVTLNHPDLIQKLVPGYNFIRNNNNPTDDNGHGTHVAGIAAAATNNGVGIAGVGYQTRIMPVKVLDAGGGGSTSDVAAGINFAINNGAKVISMSLGGSSGSSTMQSAVNLAWNNDVVLVGAAGNGGSAAKTFPSAYDNVIAVGATDPNDQRADFSNYGFWVDVAAPGSSITSTSREGGYKLMSGTSMAAPHVAGLAALLWAHLGLGSDASLIRSRIETNVLPVGSWVAKGRIDAERALFNFGPAEPIRNAIAPATFDSEVGNLLGGSLNAIVASDNARVDLAGVSSAGGKRARFRVSGSPSWGETRMAVEVGVEANTSPGGVIYCWLWNWNSGTWNLIGSQNYGSSDREQVFRTTDTGPYVGQTGEIRARIERFDSRNRPIRMRVDKVEIASVSLE